VLAAQLDHLAAVVALETISFGVIPADAEMHAIMRGGFILTKTGLTICRRSRSWRRRTPRCTPTTPAHVQVYRDQLAAFRESAVFGDAALKIVRRIAHPRS